MQGKHGAGALVTRVGIPTLAAMGVLLVAWLFLSTLSVRVTQEQRIGVSFYDVLKIFNSSAGLQGIGADATGGAGLYGLLMWVSLLLPLASHFRGHRYWALGYAAPLAFMLVMLVAVRMQITSGVNKAANVAANLGGMFGDASANAMAKQMLDKMVARTLEAISFGSGFYVGLLVAAYLAFLGVRRFLAARHIPVSI